MGEKMFGRKVRVFEAKQGAFKAGRKRGLRVDILNVWQC